MPEEKKGYPSARKRIKIEKSQFLEQLRKTPIIEVACQKMNVSRATIYRWRKDDAAFDFAFNEAMYQGRETTNDIVESSLLMAIQKGNVQLTKFYLQHNHPLYNARAAIDQRRREEFLGIKKEEGTKLTPEQQERVNRVGDALDVYLKNHEHVGLLTPGGVPDSNDPISPSNEPPSHQ